MKDSMKKLYLLLALGSISFAGSAQCTAAGNPNNDEEATAQLQKEVKEFALVYPEILTKYPELAKQAFGTSDLETLKKQGHIPTAFKRLVIEGKEFGTIIAGSILAAVAYGIVNDMVTARICLEYFSQGFHKDMMSRWASVPILSSLRKILINSNSPTTYALIWGTVATWWFGGLLGIPAALAARVGSPWIPGITAKELVKPVALTFAGVGAYTLWAGLKAYFTYRNNPVLINWYSRAYASSMIGVPATKVLGFIVNGHAHNAAYTGGAIGGLALIAYILYKRFNKAEELDEKARALLAPTEERVSIKPATATE